MFTFESITFKKDEHGYIAQQSTYAATLRELATDAAFEDFHTLRHKLARLSITRPDVYAMVNMASQVTND